MVTKKDQEKALRLEGRIEALEQLIEVFEKSDSANPKVKNFAKAAVFTVLRSRLEKAQKSIGRADGYDTLED